MNRLLIWLAMLLLDRVNLKQLHYPNSFKKYRNEIRETEDIPLAINKPVSNQ